MSLCEFMLWHAFVLKPRSHFCSQVCLACLHCNRETASTAERRKLPVIGEISLMVIRLSLKERLGFSEECVCAHCECPAAEHYWRGAKWVFWLLEWFRLERRDTNKLDMQRLSAKKQFLEPWESGIQHSFPPIETLVEWCGYVWKQSYYPFDPLYDCAL